MANTFDWIEIQAADARKIARFFEAVFGWRLVETQTAQGTEVLILDTGGEPRSENLRRVGIWQREADSDIGLRVYIVVEDIEATLREAVAHGGQVAVPLTDFGFAFMAELRDPGGNCFGLFQEKPAGRG